MFLEDVYSTMNERKSCTKHIMDPQEDIFRPTQLPRKSNSLDYGGRHFIKIVKALSVDVIDVNDSVDHCQAQKFP